MKNEYLFIIVALCGLFSAMVSCRPEKDPESGTGSVVPPREPYIDVRGHVMNEEGQFLKGIKVILDPTDFKSLPVNHDSACYISYTYEEGNYEVGTSHDFLTEVTWPEQVTVTAQDTAGIYETQTKTVPVEFQQGYTPLTKEWVDSLCANAEIDFILKQK